MNNIIQLITNIKFIKIFILGIISGMPFAILYTTLMAWMNTFELDFNIATKIASVRLPYSLKIFWAPFLEYFQIPILARLFGKRQSWMILTSLSIAIVLYHIGQITPSNTTFNQIYYLSLIIGFMAASYDISYDALRIEMLSKDEQAIGAAHSSLAYRFGCLLTGAGALSYAHTYGWKVVFESLTMLFLAATIICCLVKTKSDHIIEQQTDNKKIDFFQNTIHSFKDLATRPYFLLILGTIVMYKIGDAMLAFVGMKFYQVKGFSLQEIAFVVKVCGLTATLVGGYLGAIITAKVGNLKSLIICGVAQMITNLGYIWLNHTDHNIVVFFITNIAENFTGGMGGAALGAYIAVLCNVKFAANHFALLSSCAGLANNTLTTQSGMLTQMMGWDIYFIFTAVISIPSLFMLVTLEKKLNTTQQAKNK